MNGAYAYTGMGYEIDQEAAWDYIRDGYLLVPRTVLKGRAKLTRSELPAISADLNKLPTILQERLVSAMGNLAGERRAVMFSGGFDSMLVACLARHCGAEVTTVTVQFDGFNPKTVEGAVHYAQKIGIKHLIIHVKAVEFLSSFEELAGLTDEPILDLELAIVKAAFKKYDTGIAGNVFISGMGSDQWFGNMALETVPGGFAARLDWANVNEEAHHRVAEVHGCKFIFPFLSGDMLALSRSVPDDMKQDKKLLRALAVSNTIPHRGSRSEEQTPPFIRHTLIKMFGNRAWPGPVSPDTGHAGEYDRKLRQIILGIWLEKIER